MVRTREPAGQKKRARGSGSANPEPNPDVEMQDAPQRQIPPSRRDPAKKNIYDWVTVNFRDREHKSNFNKLKGRKLFPSRFICSQTLNKLGIFECVKQMFTNVGLWTFVSTPLDTYADLTLQFLSTLRVADQFVSMTFQLGGLMDIRLSKLDLQNILQIEYHSNRITPKPLHNYDEFITELTGLEQHTDKVAQIQHLVWKYVQKVLSHTIFGRGETSSKYKQDELAVMYCMTKHTYPADSCFPDITQFIMKHLQDIAKTPGAKGDILIGGLVTRIAMHLNVDLRSVVRAQGPNTVDLDGLVHYKIIRCTGQPPHEQYEYLSPNGVFPLLLPFHFDIYDSDTYQVPPPDHDDMPQHPVHVQQQPQHAQPPEGEPSQASSSDPFAALQSQLAQMQLGFTETFGRLSSDYSRLSSDYGQLRDDYTSLIASYTNLQSSHEELRADYTQLSAAHTELRDEMRESNSYMYDWMDQIHQNTHDASWYAREYYHIARAMSPTPLPEPTPQPPPRPTRERPRWYQFSSRSRRDTP